jgi:transposase
MVADGLDVVIGVDTHRDEHALAVIDARTGEVLAEHLIAAAPAGYREACRLVGALGRAGCIWALEGSGGYGAGLRRHLLGAGQTVAEIDRPERRGERTAAKSDALDAVRAARTLLARARVAAPRGDGAREALRVLMIARQSAIETRTRAIRQIRAIVVAAPDAIRQPLRALSLGALLVRCAALRPGAHADQVISATASALRALARRALAAGMEAREHERALGAGVRAMAPDLLAERGVGPVTAAQLIISWSHQGRIRSEAAFARLGGVAPIPASSGQIVRHRLDRGGDRQLNRALHTIVLVRRQYDPATRAYLQRRLTEGKSTREATRCLKRYVARHLFRLMEGLPIAT